MPPSLWPWVLTTASAATAWVIGNRHPAAWPLALGVQALWAVFALDTAQHGFLGSVALYTAIYARNWRRERRTRNTPPPACSCGHRPPPAKV